MALIYIERLQNGKRIEFLKRNGMMNVNYGVLDPIPDTGGTHKGNVRIMVSPTVFSFIIGPERSKVYESLFVMKDGIQTPLVDIMSSKS